MNTITFNPGDSNKCLLTELLPYETPVIFSNDHFYRIYHSFQSGDVTPQVKAFIENFVVTKTDRHRIPFNYKISKSGGAGELTLSVMHPSVQVKFISIYHTYATLIISLCQRSEFSLRFPAALHGNRAGGKKQHARPLRDDPVDAEAEGEAEESADDLLYPTSFFVYKKYNLLHKFYDSYEFQRLEKRFSVIQRFDISKCFYHIYTHTIGWAVKDKKFSKSNIGAEGFESRFDELMQMSNYNETNGILVGPEVSRIFAEIILQKIDVDVENSLRTAGLYAKRDYDVRRYVDDYFVFATNRECGAKVQAAYREALEEYKLYINDKKTFTYDTPMITGLTIAKIRIRSIVSELFSSFFQEGDGEQKSIRRLYKAPKIARNTIQKLKAAAHECGVPFENFSSYCLTMIRRRLANLCDYVSKCVHRTTQEDASVILNIVMEISSYIVAADLRVRTTYILSQEAVMVKQAVSAFPRDIATSVCTRISEDLLLIFNRGGLSLSSLEKLNLLIAISEMSRDHLKYDANLTAYFDAIQNKCQTAEESDEIVEKCGINYFAVITIMFCVKSDSRFIDLRMAIACLVEKWMANTQEPLNRADLFMVLVDLLSCPYLDGRSKSKILSAAYSRHKNMGIFTDQKINEHVKALSQVKWFVDWHNTSIDRLLRRKELRPPYGS